MISEMMALKYKGWDHREKSDLTCPLELLCVFEDFTPTQPGAHLTIQMGGFEFSEFPPASMVIPGATVLSQTQRPTR